MIPSQPTCISYFRRAYFAHLHLPALSSGSALFLEDEDLETKKELFALIPVAKIEQALLSRDFCVEYSSLLSDEQLRSLTLSTLNQEATKHLFSIETCLTEEEQKRRFALISPVELNLSLQNNTLDPFCYTLISNEQLRMIEFRRIPSEIALNLTLILFKNCENKKERFSFLTPLEVNELIVRNLLWEDHYHLLSDEHLSQLCFSHLNPAQITCLLLNSNDIEESKRKINLIPLQELDQAICLNTYFFSYNQMRQARFVPSETNGYRNTVFSDNLLQSLLPDRFFTQLRLSQYSLWTFQTLFSIPDDLSRRQFSLIAPREVRAFFRARLEARDFLQITQVMELSSEEQKEAVKNDYQSFILRARQLGYSHEMARYT